MTQEAQIIWHDRSHIWHTDQRASAGTHPLYGDLLYGSGRLPFRLFQISSEPLFIFFPPTLHCQPLLFRGLLSAQFNPLWLVPLHPFLFFSLYSRKSVMRQVEVTASNTCAWTRTTGAWSMDEFVQLPPERRMASTALVLQPAIVLYFCVC